MLKLLFAFMCLPMLFGQSVESTKLEEEIMFAAYNNGYQIEMTKQDVEKFDELFCEMMQGSYPMPAYGVSLHNETIKALQKGVWVRFVFEEMQEENGLPFDELLINVEPEFCGFNIIRGQEGVYDGRCFYINLDGDMKEVYNFLTSLQVSDKTFEEKDVQESSLVEDYLKIKEVSLIETQSAMPSINKENKENPNTVI